MARTRQGSVFKVRNGAVHCGLGTAQGLLAPSQPRLRADRGEQALGRVSSPQGVQAVWGADCEGPAVLPGPGRSDLCHGRGRTGAVCSLLERGWQNWGCGRADRDVAGGWKRPPPRACRVHRPASLYAHKASPMSPSRSRQRGQRPPVEVRGTNTNSQQRKGLCGEQREGCWAREGASAAWPEVAAGAPRSPQIAALRVGGLYVLLRLGGDGLQSLPSSLPSFFPFFVLSSFFLLKGFLLD